jgi:hypothetical protein
MLPMLRGTTMRRGVALLLLVSLSVLALAAKCIDNETLYQDSEGDWHIVGEIHNETDVWGADMQLRGALLDAAGNEIASTQTPVCPLELAAHSFNAFDLHFRNSSGLQPASYKVNVIGGRALTGPLPPSGLSLQGFDAVEVSEGVSIAGTVRSTRTYERVLTGCVAFYNAAGRVVTHVTLINFGLTLPLAADTPQPVAFTIPDFLVAPGATSIRLWLAGDSDEPLASDYASVVTDKITIE